MDLSTVCDLPFSMEIPEGCKIKRDPFNPREPSITITKDNPSYFLNLTWGKTYGNLGESPPPEYIFDGRGFVGKGPIQAKLLIAKRKSSALSAFMGGLLLWSIGLIFGGAVRFIWAMIWIFILMMAKQSVQSAGIVALLFLAICWLYVFARIRLYPSFRYSFVFKDVDYVITCDYSRKVGAEKCLRSIQFKPPDENETQGGQKNGF